MKTKNKKNKKRIDKGQFLVNCLNTAVRESQVPSVMLKDKKLVKFHEAFMESLAKNRDEQY